RPPHDVGKIGIPDVILKEPGALTGKEWAVMKAHDPIGVEIPTAAFSSESLREMIRTHNAWFGGNPQSPELPVGEAVPVGARILAVADAYDVMVTDWVDHIALPHEEACVGLRPLLRASVRRHRLQAPHRDPSLSAELVDSVGNRGDVRRRCIA